jgi:uncharacterized protein
MMILAFTDTHGDERALRKIRVKSKKADLILCCGDLTVFENHLKRILKEVNNLGKPVLLIHGNHEDEHGLKKACEGHKKIIFLHKQFHETDKYIFAGFGGGGFSLRDREFEIFQHKISERKERNKDKKLIMMFHGPPYKNRTDLIMGEHAGNKSYSDFIKKEKPDLVLCGHLHENNGKHDRIGRTLVMNPGPEGRLIKI